MARVALRLYIDPGGADVFVNLKMQNGDYYRIAALIDTGAAASMFPSQLLPLLNYRLSEENNVIIEQAGIAKQAFAATEAFVYISLEDEFGVQTREFEIRAWFADTNAALIGFDGVLDQASFHLNYLGQRTGWIEISD